MTSFGRITLLMILNQIEIYFIYLFNTIQVDVCFVQCRGSISYWYGSGSCPESDLKSRKYQLFKNFFLKHKFNIFEKNHDLFLWLWLIFANRIRLTKMNGSKRIRIRNTCFINWVHLFPGWTGWLGPCPARRWPSAGSPPLPSPTQRTAVQLSGRAAETKSRGNRQVPHQVQYSKAFNVNDR